MCLRIFVRFSQGQQNPASEALLLPLTKVSFIGSLAEVAKSCFRGTFAAFGLGELHRVYDGSSRFGKIEAD